MRRKLRLVQEMIGCLFNEADSLIEKMRTVLSPGNASELANTAYRLKGTVVYLGAHSATDATQRVEQIGKSGDLAAAEAIEEPTIQIGRLKAAVASHRGDGKLKESVGTMPFVQLRLGIKVHIASNRVKTLCGRPVPNNATETTEAPQDKDTICKACQMIEQEEKRFQQFFR